MTTFPKDSPFYQGDESQSYHSDRLVRRLAEDPEFAAEYERVSGLHSKRGAFDLQELEHDLTFVLGSVEQLPQEIPDVVAIRNQLERIIEDVRRAL